MLTVEKDKEAEQIYLHGSPEKLRWLALRLEAIAAQAEKTGSSHEHFMSEDWGGSELSNQLQGKTESAGLINHIIIYGWGNK